MNNKIAITQLGMCTVKIIYNNKQKICKFFVVPGNRQALLVMPNIDVLSIINTNINTIDMEDGRGTNNCCTNKAIPQSLWHKQQYANTMQKTVSSLIDAGSGYHNLKLDKRLSYFMAFIC